MAKSLEHLLGGYATNTLTDEEKRQLSAAALKDQALFDALADEEALKTLLADPQARQRILTSLQSSANSKETSSERKSRWGWFQQQSSLAWAGSIAAMGLALIFGWQMEKEWGPILQQEQELAKSSSRGEDVKAGSAIAPEPSSGVDAHKVDRLRQVPAVAKKENDAVGNSPEARKRVLNEKEVQPPASTSVTKQRGFDRPVPPSGTSQSPELAMSEERASQGAALGRLAAKVTEEATLQPSNHQESAQELFYAASGFLADEVMAEKKIKDKAHQDLGGVLSKSLKPSSREKALSLPMKQELAEEAAAPIAKGIRYSFVRKTKDGNDEEVDNQKISGSWKGIRLAVEPNVSGYLYVLAPLGAGKWQKLEPIPSGQTGKSEGEVKVKSFQRVEFSLGQIINLVGSPIAPSLSILLSPNPLDDLDQWLGKELEKKGLLIEQEEEAVFVVEPIPNLNKLLRMEILFGTDDKN